MDIGKPEKEIIIEPINEPVFLPQSIPAEPVLVPEKIPVPV